MIPLADLLAPEIADAFFAAIDPPVRTRWAAATVEQRRTFAACAEASIVAGRRARAEDLDLEATVAEAIVAAFWGQAAPPVWLTWRSSPQVRELGGILARAAIEAGRRVRNARTQAAA